MAEWLTPITDRTEADTVEAFNNQMIEAHLKGALNYSDLNRIENNYKYLIENLQKNGYYVNHKYRNYTETEPVVTAIEVPGEPGSTGGIVEPYIESSGTQYINTNFKANQDTRVVMDFVYISGHVIFGAYNPSWGENPFGIQVVNGKIYTYYGTGSGYSETTITANKRYLLDENKNITYLDGVAIRTAEANTFSGSNPLLLSCAYDRTAPGSFSSIRIYSCQIYDNGTLVRDFAPTLDDNGVACLYDKVEGKYYYNAGTGSFTYSENVYAPVQYIQSSGTQYIKTGFVPNQNTKITMEAELLTRNGSAAFYGSRTASGSQDYSLWAYGSVETLQIGYGTKATVEASITGYKRMYEQDKNKLYVDNQLIYTMPVATFVPNYEMLLFTCNNNGTPYSNGITTKVYSCKVYDNDVLIRDYIPVIDGSGVALLYDQLNGVPYYNAGTGSFSFQNPKTCLLIHGETIADSSVCNLNIVNKGVSVSAEQSKFGGKSLYFNGSSYLTVTSNLFITGTKDLTIDWWEYRTKSGIGTSATFNVLTNTGYSNFLLALAGTFFFGSSTSSTWGDVANGVEAFVEKLNQWSHKALVRSGSKLYIFNDGVLTYQQNITANFATGTGTLQIGRHSDDGNMDCLTGYIDEFRISGVARWTENFTPPTAPYVDECSAPGSDPTYEYIVEYVQNTYTEWFEQNIPWKSEIDRIRDNFNNLIKEYLPKSNIKTINKNQYLKFNEANKMEDVSVYTKDMTENMERNFIRCGEVNSGGERLL